MELKKVALVTTVPIATGIAGDFLSKDGKARAELKIDVVKSDNVNTFRAR